MDTRSERRWCVVVATCGLAWCFVGCAVANLEGRGGRETDFPCARAVIDADSAYRMPLAGREEDPALVVYLAQIPPEARRTALAAGLEPLLARLLREKAVSGAEATPRLLAMEQEITLRMLAFHAQVTAAAFEAGCTSDVLFEVIAKQTSGDHSRQLGLAIASLIAGALATVGVVAWELRSEESVGPPVLAIGGGVSSAVLGGLALIQGDNKFVFRHPRNRLAPVWQGTDPDHLYPSFVFRMLTYPASSGRPAPRDVLLAEWQREIDDSLPSSKRSAAKALLLGEGGTYRGSLLALRAAIFESLESTLLGFSRDLELLNRALVAALTATPKTTDAR
jgi:hypothetical protein